MMTPEAGGQPTIKIERVRLESKDGYIGANLSYGSVRENGLLPFMLNILVTMKHDNPSEITQLSQNIIDDIENSIKTIMENYNFKRKAEAESVAAKPTTD